MPSASTLSEITRDERFRNGAPLLKSVRNSALTYFAALLDSLVDLRTGAASSARRAASSAAFAA